MMAGRGRRSPFAGSWYPDDPRELRSTVARLLSDVPAVDRRGDLLALVSPHAGIRYSGPVAAWGYHLLEEASPVASFASVLLLGPSHRVSFEGLAIVNEGSFETPLGCVPIDRELARAFEEASSRVDARPEIHANEHSLEMQLPFLQRVLPRLEVLPVIMGDQSRRNVEAAARAAVSAVSTVGRPVLLVASSDLSHYESRERASLLDAEVLEAVERFDPEALADLLDRDPRHACGGGPIVAVMMAARELGANSGRVLRYADSGHVTGETNAVVGYLSAAFYRAR